MHAYYEKNRKKLKKAMNGYLRHITPESENASGKDYAALPEEIWEYCDFKVKLGAPILKAWPPVFMQGQGYK